MIPEELLSSRMLQNDQLLNKEALKSTVKIALVEKFLQGDERPCNENDFSESRKNREKITSDLQVLFKYFTENSLPNHDIENQLLALILILCGENAVIHPWNTEVIVRNCKIILSETMKIFKCKDMPEFISKNCKINLIKVLFQILCTNLSASTWKHFPAAVACYRWILVMIQQPDLSQYLQFVFPPALLLADDYINENKIIGITCLNHIIQNITVAELQFYGHGNVMFDVMMPLLRTREVEIFSSLVCPLISLTTKLEFDVGNQDKVLKWSKFDDILERYLENMELEQMIDLRNCYISNLRLLINASGFRIIKWSKRLLRIFHEYIQTAVKYNDEKTTNLCLKVIEKYTKLSSESITLYVENLLITLLLALNYINSCNSELQNESKEVAIKCIRILLKALSESDREKLKEVFQEKFSFNLNFEV